VQLGRQIQHQRGATWDAKYSISGEPPSVTTGPVGRSDGALEGFLPIYKAQDNVFVNGPPAPYGTLSPSWRDAGSKTVKQVDNIILAEYLIGSEAKFVLPESYWPKGKVSWTTQCLIIVRTEGLKGTTRSNACSLSPSPGID